MITLTKETYDSLINRMAALEREARALRRELEALKPKPATPDGPTVKLPPKDVPQTAADGVPPHVRQAWLRVLNKYIMDDEPARAHTLEFDDDQLTIIPADEGARSWFKTLYDGMKSRLMQDTQPPVFLVIAPAKDPGEATTDTSAGDEQQEGPEPEAEPQPEVTAIDKEALRRDMLAANIPPSAFNVATIPGTAEKDALCVWIKKEWAEQLLHLHGYTASKVLSRNGQSRYNVRLKQVEPAEKLVDKIPNAAGQLSEVK